MQNMNRKELSEYWITSSNGDFKTMNNLFKSRDYHWSLFIGHLVIEKLLKAYYAVVMTNDVPFTHDLLRIAEMCKLDLTNDKKDLLDLITTFNIKARYDDYKMEFYKKCTRKFTSQAVKKITEFRKWLKKQF